MLNITAIAFLNLFILKSPLKWFKEFPLSPDKPG
jgi:hypothetical protein